MKPPTTKKEVTQFLGFFAYRRYFRMYLDNMDMIAKPLTELTIKHGPNKIIWTDIHDPSKRQRFRFGLVEFFFLGGGDSPAPDRPRINTAVRWLSVNGCEFGKRGKFALSHWLELSPYNTMNCWCIIFRGNSRIPASKIIPTFGGE